MVTPKSRRAVLGTVATTTGAIVAGCSGFVGSFTGPPPDVVVFNDTDAERTVEITLTNRATGGTVVSETPTISTADAAEYPDVLASSGRYGLSVRVRDGPADSHQWRVSGDDQSLQVRIRTDSIAFDTVSP